jgi:hypothetical protein
MAGVALIIVVLALANGDLGTAGLNAFFLVLFLFLYWRERRKQRSLS